MTIARLEVCVAVIAATVAHQIVQEHRCVFWRIVFWSDASVVLHYLNCLFVYFCLERHRTH